jgi:transcriptional regulator with XRE-family HTH domain
MREAAGLTQVELSKRLKKSQAFVSGAESGASRVGERYVIAVLKACGLPEDWKG